MISLIACCANNRVIGADNKIPWHLPSDLKYFRSMTEGHSMVMGRKTFESLPGVLPNRFHVVLSRESKLLDFTSDNQVVVARSAEAALALASHRSETFIIGGEEIYKLFIDLADNIYLSVLPGDYEGDSYFPEIDLNKWKVVSSELVKDKIYYKRLKFEKSIT